MFKKISEEREIQLTCSWVNFFIAILETLSFALGGVQSADFRASDVG